LAYTEPTKLAIEVDGFGPHATRSAFDRDRARSNELVVAGWTILRFTSASTDDQIASTTAAALARLGHSRAS
jgi:very-short-patch-repair endonuclease